MTRLHQAIDVAEAGVVQLVMLCGEPGVGKTRLAQEVSVEVRDRGFLVATGRCYEPERRVPYYPMLEVLPALYRVAPEGVRNAVTRHWPDLHRLLPGEEFAGSPPLLDRRAEQHHLFLAVSAFLQALAAVAPTALLFDDLHWADDSSLALLRHLVRHTSASRILLLATYRDTEIRRSHSLQDMLVDLRREDLVERVPVDPLQVDGTAALMAVTLDVARVSDDLVKLVHEHTDGNAFFTQEVVRTLVERGDVYRQEDWWRRRPASEIVVPVTVRELIVQRLSRLEERAGAILYAASVLGQTFHFDDLRAMLPLAGGLPNLSDVEEDRLEGILDGAIHDGFLRSMGSNEYGFEHALTQQALYDDMSARRKKRLHAAAGTAIESVTEPGETRAAELVRHFVEGEEPRRALAYALLAGAQAERVFAHAEGEQHFRLASTLARDEGDQMLEAAALEGLGTVLKIVGRYDDALESLQRAMHLYGSAEDLEAMGRVGALAGETHFWRGSWEEGIATIQPLLDRLESQGPSHALAALYLAMSPLYAPTARHREQLAAAVRASELAELQGDIPMLVKSESWRGIALDELNRFAESRSVLLEILPLAEELGDLLSVARVLGYLGHGYMVEGHIDDAVSYRRRALAANEQVGDPASMAWAEARLGEVLYVRGYWQEAGNHLQHATEVFGSIRPSARHAAVATVHLGALLLMKGEWEEASRHLEEGIAQAVRANHIGALHAAQWALTDLEAAPDYPADRRRHFLSLLVHPALAESAGALQYRVLTGIDGDEHALHDASGIASGVVAAMAQEGRRLDLAMWLRLHGMTLGRQGRSIEAEAAFKEAVSVAHGMPYPYGEARARYRLGCIFKERGAGDEAGRELEAALALFRSLGAIPYIELTARALEHR
jgi:tetratricopeptide (TPR) repeat protein